MNERGDAAVSWDPWSGAHWDVVADTFSPGSGWDPQRSSLPIPGTAAPPLHPFAAQGTL